MIFRVDYILGVVLVGAVVGAILARRLSQVESAKLGRVYYALIAVRVILGAIILVCSIVLLNGQKWSRVSSGVSDAGNFLFGALFGLASFRPKKFDLLREPTVLAALCLLTGFTFISAGYSKAFYMQGMTEFFAQSGYSVNFLKFIMSVEVLGGAALLIPWAILPVVAGLSVDMFGAVYTHIHNGDPLNDSTGAIMNLIRLGAILLIWALRSPRDASRIKNRLALVGILMVICASLAVAGSAMMRHTSVKVGATQSVEGSSHL